MIKYTGHVHDHPRIAHVDVRVSQGALLHSFRLAATQLTVRLMTPVKPCGRHRCPNGEQTRFRGARASISRHAGIPGRRCLSALRLGVGSVVG